MPVISVILPCYNVKKEYLDACIQSILDQTFKDFEIIIIDDGSRPPYDQFISEIQNQDKRITVYKQTNQGVSAARNIGVEKASGEYVVFVDADDLVCPWHLEEAYHISQIENADVVYGYERISKEILHWQGFKNNGMAVPVDFYWLKKHTIGKGVFHNGNVLGRGPYCRFVKKDLAEKVRFPVGVPIGEDVLWNLALMEQSVCPYITDSAWYLYMIRDDSVAHRYTPQILQKLEPFYTRIEHYIQTDDDWAAYGERILNDLKSYVLKLYIGNKENKQTYFAKWRDFNQLSRKKPWSTLHQQRLIKASGVNERFKIALFRIKLLFPFWTMQRSLSAIARRQNNPG